MKNKKFDRDKTIQEIVALTRELRRRHLETRPWRMCCSPIALDDPALVIIQAAVMATDALRRLVPVPRPEKFVPGNYHSDAEDIRHIAWNDCCDAWEKHLAWLEVGR